jgi:hypothetical protein
MNKVRRLGRFKTHIPFNLARSHRQRLRDMDKAIRPYARQTHPRMLLR